METILKEILSEIKDLKSGQTRLEAGQTRIEKKLDAVYDQTMILCEFKTEANAKLDKLSDDLAYFANKEQNVEKDVFLIKRKLEIIK